MKLTVVFCIFVFTLVPLSSIFAWSETDPMTFLLSRLYKNQKQKNLSKIQLLPQSVNFVGPRQATQGSKDEAEQDNYDDDYADEEYEYDGDENDDNYADSYEWP